MTDVWERPVQTQTASLPAQVNDGTRSASRTSTIPSKCTEAEKGALLCDHHKYKTSHHPPLSDQAVMVHIIVPSASKPSPSTWSVRLPAFVRLPWVRT